MTKEESKKTPKRGKGRQRSLDREKDLFKDIKVIWRQGYEPACLTDLCSAMEIKVSSLYAAFGSKAKLFLEAVNYYEETYWLPLAEKLESEPDVYLGIDKFFKQAAHILISPDTPCGCLVVLAAVNISEDEREVIDVIKALRMETKAMFARRLQPAVDDGQLPAETDVASLAGAFSTMLEGLSIQSRDGLSPVEMERIASHALRLLPEKRQPA